MLVRSLVLLVSLCALPLVSAGCVSSDERVVVNAGSSTPPKLREGGRPYDGLPERSPLVAYESGLCDSDADCAPQGCESSVCSTDGLESVCVTSPVGQCLGMLPRSSCLCREGVCRWERNTAVLQCANNAVESIRIRPFPGTPNEPYPVPPAY